MSSKSSGFVSYQSGKEPVKGHLEGAAPAHELFEPEICLSLSGGTITIVFQLVQPGFAATFTFSEI